MVLCLAGATIGITGFKDSFLILAAMRVFHGMLNSATNPLSFSIIQDYFPPENRSVANSLIQAGNYIGVGVSSLSILVIKKYGWRALYKLMGGFGILFGIASAFLIKEPVRGRFLDEATKRKEEQKKREKEMNKTSMYENF